MQYEITQAIVMTGLLRLLIFYKKAQLTQREARDSLGI